MKKVSKLFLTIVLCLSFVFTALSLVACSEEEGGNGGGNGGATHSASNGGSGSGAVSGTFDYDTEFLSGKTKEELDYGYNNNLFYVNNLEFGVADPSVIYISEGADAGYFYCYGTSDEIGGHGFQSWRSKDLSHWEAMGVALAPESWAINCYWAPEVIYDRGTYFMFFGAYNLKKNNRLCLSVATSKTPYGPFKQPNGIQDANFNMLSNANPTFDFTSENPALASLNKDGFLKTNALDASPFKDPVTGKKYLYFSFYDNYSAGSHIYGVEMIDWFTPDYSTLTEVTWPGFDTVQHGRENAFGTNIRVTEGSVNEGPFMTYHDGKYYLTFSVFGYTDPNYRVKQAIADSPLGEFKKVPERDGGILLSTDTANWSHIVSAGHHSFITIGDETFVAYHTFKDRNSIAGGRALALDRIYWTENSEGTAIMQTNGPTWSVQPLPEAISGYKNIAPSATVKATNTAEGSDVALLTDGKIKYQEFDFAEEYYANQGESVITLSWKDYKTVRALMLYNSYDYDYTFVKIKKIEMTYKKANGASAVVTINDLPFDWEWNAELEDEGSEMMRPGGAAIAEFEELPVKEIKITIIPPTGEELALGEIVVLGKDAACEGVSEFKPYSYEPTAYMSGHIKRSSVNFGDIAGTSMATEYGYDLTHDDGTENAYVVQYGPADQSCFFKDVYGTAYYVEAEFTVTGEAFAFSDASNDYQHDPYPKFGLATSVDEGNTKNTIFFYVDGASNYTNKAVGVAQRMMDNTNWDWDATEQVVSVNSINYTGGNYVKLAMLRSGRDFYFLCNDKVVIHYNSFNVFSDTQKAAVGFRCFSTPMIVRNYSATADADVVSAKLAEYASVVKGETLGDAGGYHMGGGWDLTHDDGTKNAYAVQTASGDQYAYFKGINSTKYYVETEITVIEDMGDAFPKFGISSRISGNNLFYYIDGAAAYSNKAVGYVQRNNADDDWVWASSAGAGAMISYSSLNGEENYTKLGVLRDGASFRFYVDGKLALSLENARGFDENTPSVVGILSFTTGIKVRNYFATTDEAFIAATKAGSAVETNGALSNATSGWDLSHDDGTENAYAIQTLGGDQYAYFDGINGTDFYVETEITVTADLGDGWPKFGIALKSASNTFFFFIDGHGAYTTKEVGWVQFNSDGSNWDWAGSVQYGAEINYSSLNGEEHYAKLGLLRRGNVIKLYVNGTLVATLDNIRAMGADDNATAAVLSFTTGIKVRNYRATTEESEFPA